MVMHNDHKNDKKPSNDVYNFNHMYPGYEPKSILILLIIEDYFNGPMKGTGRSDKPSFKPY